MMGAPMSAAPVVDLGPYAFPAHLLIEASAYAVGFAVIRRNRRKGADPLPEGTRFRLLVATIVGAIVGAKLLHHLASPSTLARTLADPQQWLAGKTIVGALLGGLVGTELVKKRMGLRRSTGDMYALPLALGIAIGRVGCFLGGLGDGTYGCPTDLPWGVDLGDGIARHPAPLYESAGMALMAAFLIATASRDWREGSRFRLVFGYYFALRIGVDVFRPVENLPGWSALGFTGRGPGVLQAFSVLGLAWALWPRGAALASPRNDEVVHG